MKRTSPAMALLLLAWFITLATRGQAIEPQAIAGRFFTAEGSDDYFGYSVASAGGVNGDGYDDVVVGATYAGAAAQGRVYLFLGGSVTDAVAMGTGPIASGDNATAMGGSTTASGQFATAMGRLTTAGGDYATALGAFTTAGGVTATEPLFVAGNGSSDALRSNALTQASDARLKQDLAPLTGVLPLLAQLQPVRYRFLEGTGHTRALQIGLLAQEVEQVFPELVSRDSEGYLSVAYANLSAVLVEAVKELRAENEALRAAQERQQAQIETLTILVARLTGAGAGASSG